ncbi:ABC transporter substrate-binding protein [Nostoc sp.]|uniref:ABC transporter substrate-binding protein n=1 Tax=Nostoc sp. TaxID=1180 RepID=UPI002FFB5011
MSKIRLEEIAKQRIESFAKLGKAHLYLAYHAAFPLALTPDLLYRLWVQFQRDIDDEVLGIPWVAVADLLVSSLCDEVGHELYEMDLAVRNELLSRLQEDKKFGQQRINELSNFLLDYVRPKLESKDPDIKDFALTQKWTALAYTQPNKVAHELALEFSKLDFNNEAELIRIVSLTETFAQPLAEFDPLLSYASGMGKLARGDLEAATDQISKILGGENKIRVAGVDLPIPEKIKANLPELFDQLANHKNALIKSRFLSPLFLSVLALGMLIGGTVTYSFSFYGSQLPQNSLCPKQNYISGDSISLGEEILEKQDTNPDKEAGVKAFFEGDCQLAIDKFNLYRKNYPADPEALIYLNNAKARQQGKWLKIAVSVPIGTNPNVAKEILRGVAQAQDEVNSSTGINGKALEVGIANDNDNPEIAKQIASSLVSNPEVLGVVGPITSDCTLAAGTIYTSGELVAISPTSTSVKISNFSRYVFRTVPSDFIAARSLANYMVKTLQKKNAAVFFNSESNYSRSLKSEFVSSVLLEGGQVSSEFDLSKADFSAAKSIEQATKQGAEVLMLAANTETLDKALQVIQINQKKLTLLAGDDVYTAKTLQIGREQAEGMMVAIPWNIDSKPNSNFVQNSKSLWKAPVSWRTATSYDATKAIIAALKINPTRNGLQQTLHDPSFSVDGATGKIQFLPSGDRKDNPTLLVKVQQIPGTDKYEFVPIQP